MFPRFSPIACLALATFLSACGGGSADGTPPVTQAKAPVALADTLSVTANQEATLDVLSNDSHPDKLALELVSVGTAAHGTAALKNGTLVYTPAAGYYGTDKISYTIRAAGGTASATGEATVTVGMPLRLSGKIGIRSGLDSTVTVKAGTRVFTQTLTEGRDYDVPVVLEAPEQMVSITVQGIGSTSSRIKMITLAGDARSLLAASGGSGRLQDSQWPDLNVSLQSSGKYGALRDANGGAVPADQAALDAANQKITQAQIYLIAGMMRLASYEMSLTQPALPLPAGVSDTLALIENKNAYVGFAKNVFQNQAELINTARETLLQETFQMAQPSIGLDRDRTLVLDNGMQSGASPGLEVRLAANGGAQVSIGNTMAAGGWSKGIGSLDIGFPNPVERNGFTAHDDSGVFLINSVKLRQVTGSQDHGLMAVTTSGLFSYTRGGTPFVEPYEETMTYTFHAWDSLPAVTAQDVAGKTLAGLPLLSASTSSAQARIAFAVDGTASMLEMPGVSATWTVINGKVHVVFSDGTVFDMARVSNAAPNDQRWLVRYTNAADVRLYGAAVAEAQPGLAFTSPAQAVHTWTLGISELSGAYFIKLNGDLTGLETTLHPDGTRTDVNANAWALDSGRLLISVYRRANGSRVGVCPAGETCTLYSRRDWTLLRDDGNTITVLDNYTRSQATQARVLTYFRDPS